MDESLATLPGLNTGYAAAEYERYLDDPNSVDPSWRSLFDGWRPHEEAAGVPEARRDEVLGVVNLAHAVRAHGHLDAQLDPLGSAPPNHPSLRLETHDLTEDALRRLPAHLAGGERAGEAANALEAIRILRNIFCSRIGYDYDHIRDPEQRRWLWRAAESGRFRPPEAPIDEVGLLRRLSHVEVFERFLHRIFPGRTRFSIEGLDMMVPMLDEFVGAAVAREICMLFIGMSHRGRLNVLAHILQKPYETILAEFRDPKVSFTARDELGWAGDVKYHKGTCRPLKQDDEIGLLICMPPNPSHLEHVNPVLQGMARAADTSVDAAGPPQIHPDASLSVLIHGDASFTGQGVNSETLNLSRLPAYSTGGTLHIIANNQLGFTAEPQELRSSLHPSDLAKGFKIPVIHVNADDPVACIEAARTAVAYRNRFNKDFVINLIGYRRYGHNEGDEPSFTQPRMYVAIRSHPSVREQWAEQLVERGLVESDLPEALVQRRMEDLQQTLEALSPEEALEEHPPESPPPGAARRVETALPLERLRSLHQELLSFPDGFNLHSKLERFVERRRSLLDEPEQARVSWSAAESLALGSILEDGVAVRMSGEDTMRGTFNQRHAAFFDTETGAAHIPFHGLSTARAAFEIHNTPLTENAVLGFEYGYSVQAPDRLVIWEAQYGDFINIAQIMVDEFVTSARAKWGQTPSLVLLLPHGNEGQGPDHSSARVERFLGLAAEFNLRLASPTTAAQYFHLLRRQAKLLVTDPLPLIVLTHKGLLRHPRLASTPQELAQGAWTPVIDDPAFEQDRERAERLVLCSGRIYIDLVESDHREDAAHTAIARLEQLYPFPAEGLTEVFERYTSLDEVIWAQEEPRNMGAWRFLRPRLRAMLGDDVELHYVGRAPNSSPAEGSSTWYKSNQEALIEQVYASEERAVEQGPAVERR